MGANWVQLTSGGGYDFDQKEIFGPFDVKRDLAKPLSVVNRCGGHADYLWPVAIHSVAVARTIESMTKDPAAAFAGLMHDAHECVIGDILTPVARYIGYEQVNKLKSEVQTAVEQRLNIRPEFSALNPANVEYIRLADLAALHIERQLFLVPSPRDWGYPVPPNEWLRTMYGHMREMVDDNWDLDGGCEKWLEYYSNWVQYAV